MPDVFSTVQDVDSTVVLDYTSRDFTAIRAQLVGLAKGFMPDWTTCGEPSDFGTLLLEMWAYMGDVMHFYIDRTASEAFLGTALRRQSVLYIADMLGYTPIGQQSAIVKLVFNISKDAEKVQTIPAGTRIHNQASNINDLIVFETNMDAVLTPMDPVTAEETEKRTIYATEGIMHYDEQLTPPSSGTPNTEYVIPNKGVVYGSLSLKSREGPDVIEWSYISDLSLARPTQSVFTTFIDEAEYTHVIFGDNAAGRIPPINAQIFLTYRAGVGVEANSLAPGSLTEIRLVEETSDIDLWGVTVGNPESPVGGTDPETVDAMRNSIPRAATRLKNRAITLNDYADLAMQVPGVSKSMAHGSVYTSVHVKIAPTQGQGNDDYMDKLADSVEAYLADKIIVGSHVQVEPTSPDAMDQLWETIFIRVMVHVQDAYNRTTVRHTVESAIRQMLAFDNVDFGTRVSIGTVYRTALSVQGVEWVDLFWLHTEYPGLTDPESTNPELDPIRIDAEEAVWNQDIDASIEPTDRIVADVVTDERLIPKIDPTKIVEPNDDGSPWEGWSTEEVTHDGLWVQAVGGLSGT
jgi:hypothetical protein